MQQNRRNWLMKIGFAIAAVGLAKVNSFASSGRSYATTATGSNMKLGAFSVSLNVKDLTASKQFYEALGLLFLAVI